MAGEGSKKVADRDALIVEYQTYARALAHKLMKRMGLPGEQLDEFIAAGYLGLVEAAERFEAESGIDFKNFAYLRIRGAIIDAIRESSSTSERGYRFARAYHAVKELQEDSIDHVRSLPTDLKLGSEFTLAQILEYAAQGALVFRLSFDDVDEDVLSDEGEGGVEERLLLAENRKFLHQTLETLPEKERLVIREHYFQGKSFLDIGKAHGGVSKSWVSRIHTRAIQLLSQAYAQNMVKQDQEVLAGGLTSES